MGKTCRSRKLKLSCSRDFCIVWTSLIYATNCPQKMQNNPTNDSFKGKLILAEEITIGRVSWKAIESCSNNFGSALFYVLAFIIS